MNILDMQKVSKVYGSGYVAVKAVVDADLHVQKKEIVLIMGPSGSGKTTLLTMAGALLRPSNGQITINGRVLDYTNQKNLSLIRLKNIGFIFQSFNLLSSLSALENVYMPMLLSNKKKNKARLRAAELLKRLGLEKRINHYPKELSGGEQQRVAIARALANEPSLILADEPTGNLDSKTGHEVVMLLYDIAKEEGRSVVIVSHDQRLMDVATRMLWLEDGKLSDRIKEKSEVVKDIVCGMMVEKEETKFVSYYKGKPYYFCSEKCLKKFSLEPKRYINI